MLTLILPTHAILNYIFKAIHIHLTYSLKVCLWKKFKNFVSKFQIYSKTSYCFSFYFPSNVLTHVSYTITLFYNILFK